MVLQRLSQISLITILLATSLSAAAQSIQCSATSPARRIALLELYTSEGCSSCPPADSKLSQFKHDKRFQGRVVPLSMHVDYWNYLGWRDPYAQALFSQRQREQARRKQLRTIYTPQFILNGMDFRQRGFWAALEQELQTINQTPATASLQLTLSSNQASQLTLGATARLHDSSQASQAQAYFVIYENNLLSQVQAGENARRELKHDYVVRRMVGPIGFNAQGKAQWKQQLPLAPEWQQSQLGLAGFVQRPDNGEILQAFALPMCVMAGRQ